MKALFVFLCVSLLITSGCVSPNPYLGGPAPVVDRSSVANAPVGAGNTRVGVTDQPNSNVEVTPLDQAELGVTDSGDGGLVVEDVAISEPPGPPTVTRRPKPEPPPISNQQRPNQAVVALLDSAARHVASQDLDKAAADLERAVRIEPGNAAIWHDLGQIRLHQSRYDDAIAMASKSTGLAGSNRSLKALNWRIIAVAKRSLGDDAGADAAEASAALLE